jgi:hypothetical protein
MGRWVWRGAGGRESAEQGAGVAADRAGTGGGGRGGHPAVSAAGQRRAGPARAPSRPLSSHGLPPPQGELRPQQPSLPTALGSLYIWQLTGC